MNNSLNKFFNKIFVINLFDKTKRWKKVSGQFKRRNIKVTRFIAIDGRCKSQNPSGCQDKLDHFKMIYNIKILTKRDIPLKELVPASSLTIGTILILREMVKKKWKRILICEDDIELPRNFDKRFKQGIKELGNKKWDILYLGCGWTCGIHNISKEKTTKNKYLTQYNQFYKTENWFIQNKNDLRSICDIDKCKPITEHISKAYQPSGTWCYAYSLKGAKKLLKLIDNNAGEHIDRLIQEQIKASKLEALAFDPPLVMHEGGALRSDSDIPWKY